MRQNESRLIKVKHMSAVKNGIKNILLIEDDDDDCLFLSLALATITDDITLYCKKDVDQLFETINMSRPSLIIIDFYMQKRSGLELLRQIKDNADYKDIPVVMWCTSYMCNHVAAVYREGAQTFIQKPCCFTELVSEIKVILLFNKIGLPDFTDTYSLRG